MGLSLLLALRATAAGQEAPALRGTLVDAETGRGIDGARVVLLDARGVEQGETLASADGAFLLRVALAGEYRVLVSRIGYESWTSGPIRVPREGASVRLSVPVRPVPLPALAVTDSLACPTTPEERERAYWLYERALPGLRAVVEGDGRDGHVFAMRLILPKTVRRPRGGVRVYRADTVTTLVPRPLETRAPGELARHGYAEAADDTLSRFHAPTAGTLADPSFLATHCLTVTAHREEPWLGLGFQPKPDREVVEVEGTLWLDTLTDHRPRRLDYRYTRLRPFLRVYQLPLLRAGILARIPERFWNRVIFHRIAIDSDMFGGELTFERLEDGSWITRRWEIRSPVLVYSRLTESGRSSVRPRAIAVMTAGDVLALVPRADGDPPDGR